MSTTCYIFGASKLCGHFPMPTPSDIIIAADGGYQNCELLGIKPNIIVGDFDSAPMPSEAQCDIIITYPTEKDDTDTALAINHAIALGCDKFYLLACTQGRLDHTLANISCLAYLANKGFEAYMAGEGITITALCDASLNFLEGSFGTISVFSHSTNSNGVSIRGAKYEIYNETLYNTRALGISNALIGTSASIEVTSGTLIVIFPDSLLPNLIPNAASKHRADT